MTEINQTNNIEDLSKIEVEELPSLTLSLIHI